MLNDLKLAGASWLKTFIAAALATYLAVGLDIEAIVNAAAVATIPSIINWLNPKYERYGKVR
jgi:hypothetical protein